MWPLLNIIILRWNRWHRNWVLNSKEMLLGNRVSWTYSLKRLMLSTLYILIGILINHLRIINILISTTELFLRQLIWISKENLFILKNSWVWIESLEFLNTKWFLFSTFDLISLYERFFCLQAHLKGKSLNIAAVLLIFVKVINTKGWSLLRVVWSGGLKYPWRFHTEKLVTCRNS